MEWIRGVSDGLATSLSSRAWDARDMPRLDKVGFCRAPFGLSAGPAVPAPYAPGASAFQDLVLAGSAVLDGNCATCPHRDLDLHARQWHTREAAAGAVRVPTLTAPCSPFTRARRFQHRAHLHGGTLPPLARVVRGRGLVGDGTVGPQACAGVGPAAPSRHLWGGVVQAPHCPPGTWETGGMVVAVGHGTALGCLMHPSEVCVFLPLSVLLPLIWCARGCGGVGWE